MLIAVTRYLGKDSNIGERVLLDEGVEPEPEYPVDQTFGW
jgi:hypothetical protein